ncbi:basic leucine zipper 43-like [Euphorbia lathyris]|uniref:basic leucine zipper 43-like n=1 Tax=Euphorbia lathyris TaxID=212925 RepID=UPI0033144943
MEAHEIKQLHSHSSFENLLTLSPTNHILSQNPDNTSTFFNTSFSPIHFPCHIFSPNTNSTSTESILNEAIESQAGTSSERRLKRMKSNRESARRSRMRKKRQIEELQCQVNHLQTMNHQLSDKVIHLLETNHQILQENSQLKERVSALQVLLSDLFPSMKVEDKIWATNRLQGEIDLYTSTG